MSVDDIFVNTKLTIFLLIHLLAFENKTKKKITRNKHIHLKIKIDGNGLYLYTFTFFFLQRSSLS